MKLTASQLRQNIYKILDSIVETGSSVEIERNGHLLQITQVKRSYSKLSKLKKRKITDEDSENFTHIDWSHEWKGVK
ncbi:MAG: type II toxin-antitoxin system Phd/YefM family antitoxin [Oligoflexia bacterium]|nr:type II toxin-antitoxin system Phd/YefM family antitoxin [Oligoflexia bacterium]